MTDVLEPELRVALAERSENLPAIDADEWLAEFNSRSRTGRRPARLRPAVTAATAVVVACIVATVVLLSSLGTHANHQPPPSGNLTIPAAYVGWTPVPAKAAAAQAKSAATRCRYFAAHKSHLGAPVIIDARGPYVEVLFVDQRDNYERYCVYGPHLGMQGGNLIRSRLFANARPDSIQASGEGGSCNPATGQAVSEMHGQAGAMVTGATMRFSNGTSVQATVKHGFYVAWWPWALSPTEIIVSTRSGGTTDISLPGGNRPSRC